MRERGRREPSLCSHLGQLLESVTPSGTEALKFSELPQAGLLSEDRGIFLSMAHYHSLSAPSHSPSVASVSLAEAEQEEEGAWREHRSG